MWVYQKTESALWTVGYYDPKGQWHSESDHDDPEKAAARCSYLNGLPEGPYKEAVLASGAANEITFSLKIPDKASKLMELAADLGEALKKFREDTP